MDPFNIQGIGAFGGLSTTSTLSPLGTTSGTACQRCCGTSATSGTSAASMAPMMQMMQMQQQMMMVLLQLIMQLLTGKAAGGTTGTTGSSATGSSGTGGSGAASNVSNVDLSAVKGGTAWGKSLAADAFKNATGTGGWCFKYAGAALRRFGVQTSGASAYMAADQMAKSSKFKEVKVSAADLTKLPPGAVVVWSQSAGHPHGHISIASGDGREASDVIRKQTTSLGGSTFRVFLPNQ